MEVQESMTSQQKQNGYQSGFIAISQPVIHEQHHHSSVSHSIGSPVQIMSPPRVLESPHSAILSSSGSSFNSPRVSNDDVQSDRFDDPNTHPRFVKHSPGEGTPEHQRYSHQGTATSHHRCFILQISYIFHI